MEVNQQMYTNIGEAHKADDPAVSILDKVLQNHVALRRQVQAACTSANSETHALGGFMEYDVEVGIPKIASTIFLNESTPHQFPPKRGQNCDKVDGNTNTKATHVGTSQLSSDTDAVAARSDKLVQPIFPIKTIKSKPYKVIRATASITLSQYFRRKRLEQRVRKRFHKSQEAMRMKRINHPNQFRPIGGNPNQLRPIGGLNQTNTVRSARTGDVNHQTTSQPTQIIQKKICDVVNQAKYPHPPLQQTRLSKPPPTLFRAVKNLPNANHAAAAEYAENLTESLLSIASIK